MTKSIRFTLLILFMLLQYKLWFAEDSVPEVWRLHQTLQGEQLKNQKATDRNQTLAAHVSALKHGGQALEERARNDLGMVKDDETYYRIIDKP